MKSMLKSLMSVAVAALALTSCSNDATEDVMPNGGSKTLVVNATIDRTRTTLDNDHVNLEWANGDQVHLYIGETATQEQVIDHTIKTDITGVDYKDKDKVYAYYSIKANAGSDGVTMAQLNIPTRQKQTQASVFEGKNMPMVASGTISEGKVGLAFQPVGCVLVFNVYGPAENEQIKSIRFTTSVPCGGYSQCDLTDEPVQYTPYEGTKSVAVEFAEGASASIVAAKPTGSTQLGSGNQVYLVVAQAKYPAGSKFVVTTDAGEYTFTTTQELDCATSTARVVNLNLANAAGFSPEIIVSAFVPEQSSTGGPLEISGITFKNISTEQVKNARVAVYSDEELTTPLNPSWISFPNSAAIVDGVLNCEIAANAETASRTAYIGIECGDVKSSAIAVTQVGAGSTPAETVEVSYVPSEMGYKHDTAVPSATLDNGAVTLQFARGTHSNLGPKYNSSDPSLRCYEGNTITVKSDTKILKIEFVCAKGGNGKLSAKVGVWSDNTLTWEGKSNNVELSVIKGMGKFYISSMKITYIKGSGSGEQPDPTPDPEPDPEPDQPFEGNTASLTVEDIGAFTWNGSRYIDFSITATDGSVWTGFCSGNDVRLQIGDTFGSSDSAKKSYVLVPNADKVIKKITLTPEGSTLGGRVLVLLPENFDCTGKSKEEVKEAAYEISDETVKNSTDPIMIDLTDNDPRLKRFIIRVIGGTVYLSNIKIEYEE